MSLPANLEQQQPTPPTTPPPTPMAPAPRDDENEVALRCISAMLSDEDLHPCHDYLKQSSSSSSAKSPVSRRGAVDARCRADVVRWMFRTVANLRMRTETAVIAVSNLDRYLCMSRRAMLDRKEYQRASMASLYIAIRLNESVDVGPSILSSLSRGLRSSEIAASERDILRSLGGLVNGPTPARFIGCILKLLPESPRKSNKVAEELYRLSSRRAERSLEDSRLFSLRRSTVAIASVLNSLPAVTREDFSAEQRIEFVKSVSDAFGIEIATSPLIRAVRMRLASEEARRASSSTTATAPAPPKAEKAICVTPAKAERARRRTRRVSKQEPHVVDLTGDGGTDEI